MKIILPKVDTGSIKSFASAAALVLMMISIVFAGALGFSRHQCFSKWEQSGMGVDWTASGGCFVEPAPGRWVPAVMAERGDV